MNVLRVIVFKKDNGKFGWKFVNKSDDVLAESPKEYDSLEGALADAELVCGLKFNFDSHGLYQGLYVIRTEAVGLTYPQPEVTHSDPEPEPEVVGNPDEEVEVEEP